MRRKTLKAAELLCLCLSLSAGMAGCAGQADGKRDTSGIQNMVSDESNETESSKETNSGHETKSAPEPPDTQTVETQPDDREQESSGEIKDSPEAKNVQDGEGTDSEEEHTESVYFEGADLNGRVLEFSDQGFTMTPIYTVVYADGSRNSWEAAPGKEKEEDNLYITYTEDTIFEVVYFSMSLQDVSSREYTDKSNIKKQSVVYVFGSSKDDKNWIADKVLIQRWD